jgi:hypothetical protein
VPRLKIIIATSSATPSISPVAPQIIEAPHHPSPLHLPLLLTPPAFQVIPEAIHARITRRTATKCSALWSSATRCRSCGSRMARSRAKRGMVFWGMGNPLTALTVDLSFTVCPPIGNLPERKEVTRDCLPENVRPPEIPVASPTRRLVPPHVSEFRPRIGHRLNTHHRPAFGSGSDNVTCVYSVRCPCRWELRSAFWRRSNSPRRHRPAA